jgi:succinyl-CoA synthetase alpha subunit
MSILVNGSTRLIVQGFTGVEGRRHAAACAEYGTKVVGGVSPSRAGSSLDGVAIFGSVFSARKETGADASVIFVPPAAAMDAILEALDAGIATIVCVTEGVPTLDMVRIRRVLPDYPGSRLIGPNCPGVISPGSAKVGIMPGAAYSPGRVGVVSRSGTLMYEAAGQLGALDIGQSTCVGIGGDPVPGSGFVEMLTLFEADEDTDAVLLIGEIGGEAEEAAAAYIRSSMTKPVAAFVAGASAPPGRRMGHAGAIAGTAGGTAAAKKAALMAAGVIVARDPGSIGQVVSVILGD